jgi:hypothetical protein
MESLGKLVLELLVTGEAANLPPEEMIQRFEFMAGPLARKIVSHAVERMDFPEILTAAQRSHIAAECVEEFKKYFLTQAAIATAAIARANLSQVQ